MGGKQGRRVSRMIQVTTADPRSTLQIPYLIPQFYRKENHCMERSDLGILLIPYFFLLALIVIESVRNQYVLKNGFSILKCPPIFMCHLVVDWNAEITCSFLLFNTTSLYCHKTILIIILISTKKSRTWIYCQCLSMYLLIASVFLLSDEVPEDSGHISHLFYIPHSF